MDSSPFFIAYIRFAAKLIFIQNSDNCKTNDDKCHFAFMSNTDIMRLNFASNFATPKKRPDATAFP